MMQVRNLVGWVCGKVSDRLDPKPPRQPVRVIPGVRQPELGPLCENFEDSTDAGPWLSQVKADGLRAFCIDGSIVSREGGVLDCARHCLPGLARIEAAIGEPMVIDGEYVEEGGFDATIGAHKRGEGSGVFWVFDAVPLSEWLTGRFTQPIEQRLDRLRAAVGCADSPFVGFLAPTPIMNRTAALAHAQTVWAAGYEGVVLKRVGSLYERRRTAAWAKLKKLIVADCPIVDILTAKDGRCTGIICKGPTGPLRVSAGISARHLNAFALLAASNRGLDGALARLAWNEQPGSSRPRHVRYVELV